MSRTNLMTGEVSAKLLRKLLRNKTKVPHSSSNTLQRNDPPWNHSTPDCQRAIKGTISSDNIWKQHIPRNVQCFFFFYSVDKNLLSVPKEKAALPSLTPIAVCSSSLVCIRLSPRAWHKVVAGGGGGGGERGRSPRSLQGCSLSRRFQANGILNEEEYILKSDGKRLFGHGASTPSPTSGASS